MWHLLMWCDFIFHYQVFICTVSPPFECPLERTDNWPDSNHLTICPDLSKSVLWFESEECDLSDGLDMLQTRRRAIMACPGLWPQQCSCYLRRFWMFDNQNRTEQRFDRLLSGAPLSFLKRELLCSLLRSYFDLAQMHESPGFKDAKLVEIQIL